MREMAIRLGLGLAGVIAGLPHGLRRRIEGSLGWLLFHGVSRRRKIALRNLDLCLPALTADQRRLIVREHFAHYARAFFRPIQAGQMRCDSSTRVGGGHRAVAA